MAPLYAEARNGEHLGGMLERDHDAFLSYNWHDKPVVRECAFRLERERIRPFLDEWSLTPGAPWRPELAVALERSRAAVFFFGKAGAGNVHLEEMRVALRRAATNPHFPIIGVHLPGSLKDRAAIPEEIKARTWIEFRDSIDELEPWRRLLEGIRGRAPGPPVEVRALGEAAQPRLELELDRAPGSFRAELRTAGGRPLRTDVVLPQASGLAGAALAEAVFGPETQHAHLAQAVLRGSRPEGLLELGARLDVLSHHEVALALPWRSMRIRGLRLEHGCAPWSFALHRLGLARAAVRLRFPCPVWLIGGDRAAVEGALRRIQDRQPGLEKGYVRKLTRKADVLFFAERAPPTLVYYAGKIDSRTGALALEDGALMPGELRHALQGPAPALLYLDVPTEATPLAAALAWDSLFSCVVFHPCPLPAGRGPAVLAEVAAGSPPPLAVAKVSAELDAALAEPFESPMVLGRFTDWTVEGAPKASEDELRHVLPTLDRNEQRMSAFGHVHELVRGQKVPARVQALHYFGPAAALPSHLSDVLADYLARALGSDHRVVRLFPGPLPDVAPEKYKPMAEVKARLGSVTGAPDEPALITWLDEQRDRRRTTVFWVDWGCYPGHGRARDPKEVVRWFAGERDFLARGILDKLPDTYWVSVLGQVSDKPPSKLRKQFDKLRSKYLLELGFAEAALVPPLDAPVRADLKKLLSDHRGLFSVHDDAQRARVADAIFEKHDDEPSYAAVLEELRLLYELGPTEYLDRFETDDDDDDDD